MLSPNIDLIRRVMRDLIVDTQVNRMAFLANPLFATAALTTLAYFRPVAHIVCTEGSPPLGWTTDTIFDIIRTSGDSAIASYDHLEESQYHEAVHASLDKDHRLADGWQQAQASDGRLLRPYGAQHPKRQDLAETALFAFAILHHPGRFPPADAEATMRAVPLRIACISRLLPRDKPLIYSVGDERSCR
jgi:hypothetical protein